MQQRPQARANRFVEHFMNFEDVIAVQNNDAHQHLIRLTHLIQGIIAPKFAPPFKLMLRRGRPQLTANRLGFELVHALEVIVPVLSKSFLAYQRSPALQAFLAICDAAVKGNLNIAKELCKVTPLQTHPEDFKFVDGDETVSTAKEYNQLALTLRQVLRTPEIRQAEKSFKRNATERYRQLMYVARQAWARHAKILLIRIDWGFRTQIPAFRISHTTQPDFNDRARQVSLARAEMLRLLRQHFKSDLIFYAWTIECGDFKGLHVHWLIGVNGSVHQDKINVPRQVQAMWDAKIGGGKTYTFNINALRGEEDSGLRVINYDDPELWTYMGRYADYLTKVDYNMKLRMPQGMRSFGCSKLTPHKGAKRGPKRSRLMSALNIHAVRGPQGGGSSVGNSRRVQGAVNA